MSTMLEIMKVKTRAVKGKLFNKKRGSKELMIELGLAVVGVVLLIVFREQITNLITTLVTEVTSKIRAIFPQ